MKETAYGTFNGHQRKDGSWEIRLQPNDTNAGTMIGLCKEARKIVANEFNLTKTTILIQRSKCYNTPCFIAWSE